MTASAVDPRVTVPSALMRPISLVDDRLEDLPQVTFVVSEPPPVPGIGN